MDELEAAKAEIERLRALANYWFHEYRKATSPPEIEYSDDSDWDDGYEAGRRDASE